MKTLLLAFSLTDCFDHAEADKQAAAACEQEAVARAWLPGYEVRRAKRYFRIRHARGYRHYEVFGQHDTEEILKRMGATRLKLAAEKQAALVLPPEKQLITEAPRGLGKLSMGGE